MKYNIGDSFYVVTQDRDDYQSFVIYKGIIAGYVCGIDSEIVCYKTIIFNCHELLRYLSEGYRYANIEECKPNIRIDIRVNNCDCMHKSVDEARLVINETSMLIENIEINKSK